MSRPIAHRFWCTNGFNIAVVATAGMVNDWAAYIGATNANRSEMETVADVIDHGAKLSEHEARAFFPEVPAEVSYRW